MVTSCKADCQEHNFHITTNKGTFPIPDPPNACDGKDCDHDGHWTVSKYS